MPKSYGRFERVAALVRKEAARLIQHEIKDPRVVGAQATVTEVNVSADLRKARIYVSFLNDDEQKIKAGMEGLAKATGFVRSSLASSLKLRYMPAVEFVFDELLKRSIKLDALIASGLGKGEEQIPDDEGRDA